MHQRVDQASKRSKSIISISGIRIKTNKQKKTLIMAYRLALFQSQYLQYQLEHMPQQEVGKQGSWLWCVDGFYLQSCDYLTRHHMQQVHPEINSIRKRKFSNNIEQFKKQYFTAETCQECFLWTC